MIDRQTANEPIMDETVASTLRHKGSQTCKREKMLLAANSYWLANADTNKSIVFVAPTHKEAAGIRDRFFRLLDTLYSFPFDTGRVRCLSLSSPDLLNKVRGIQNVAFFFDYTCLENGGDSLWVAGKLVDAILGYRLGEIVFDGQTKKKEPKEPEIDLKPRREVDRLRTADILQAMTMRNATDQAIPEEWMDELDDLVWRERDRLAAAAGS
jgi:hypothetical protein